MHVRILNAIHSLHTYIHTYIGKQVSLVGEQLSVPSRCTAVYTWLLIAGVTSGRGDPALLGRPSFGKPWLTFNGWLWQYWNCQVLANLPYVSQVLRTSKPGNGLLRFTELFRPTLYVL